MGFSCSVHPRHCSADNDFGRALPLNLPFSVWIFFLDTLSVLSYPSRVNPIHSGMLSWKFTPALKIDCGMLSASVSLGDSHENQVKVTDDRSLSGQTLEQIFFLIWPVSAKCVKKLVWFVIYYIIHLLGGSVIPVMIMYIAYALVLFEKWNIVVSTWLPCSGPEICFAATECHINIQ